MAVLLVLRDRRYVPEAPATPLAADQGVRGGGLPHHSRLLGLGPACCGLPCRPWLLSGGRCCARCGGQDAWRGCRLGVVDFCWPPIPASRLNGDLAQTRVHPRQNAAEEAADIRRRLLDLERARIEEVLATGRRSGTTAAILATGRRCGTTAAILANFFTSRIAAILTPSGTTAILTAFSTSRIAAIFTTSRTTAVLTAFSTSCIFSADRISADGVFAPGEDVDHLLGVWARQATRWSCLHQWSGRSFRSTHASGSTKIAARGATAPTSHELKKIRER